MTSGILVRTSQCVEVLSSAGSTISITVPASAIFDQAGKDCIYVKLAGEKTKRPVVLGKTHAGKVEIVKGLKPGEIVYRNASK